uniref:Peroxiredoxin-like 2A n=1 Tax=Paramormyrops kingsleyae TaxID=1676925 RepID=A0A3B3S885_9TELE
MWSLGLGAIGAAIAGIFLANTDLLLDKPEPASVEYLGETDLKTIADEKTFKAGSLWERSGAVVMAVRRPGFLCREEAAELSSLKPQLDQLGVPLYAVVKENIESEVHDFKPFFSGDVFLDEKQQHFYGPAQRKMGGLGIVRLGVWANFLRAWRNGHSGNVKGEGFILGGMFVIGAGEQGILLEHREKEFGDKVNISSVLEAARKI